MLIIHRTYHETHTESWADLPDGTTIYFLERPDRDNRPYISCIPEGEYLVDRDKTGKHRWYSVRDVEGRSAIELHPANRVEQLQGCLAPCMEIYAGQAIRSREACELLLKWYGDNSFPMLIKEE